MNERAIEADRRARPPGLRASEAVDARLREVVQDAMASLRVPGCSIALTTASGVAWSAGVGFADLRSLRPARPDTIYHLFSGTKLFTATAVLQLAEQGRLGLDDRVAKFVPEAASTPTLSLRHLLSHQSGLKDTLKALLAVTLRGQTAPTTLEALRRYRLVAARRPGERVEYRNVNYALLGEVVTRASGLEYRDYMTRHVLKPLDLSAGFSLAHEMRPHAATGYIGRWDPMRLALRVLLPDVARGLYAGRLGGLMELGEFTLDTAAIGGLVGSVTEFARFLQMQLSGGAGVLGPQSTRLMQTMAAEGAAGIESRVGVGLGWKIGRVADRTFLNHEGGGAGFTSELRLYPEAGIGIALAMNAMRMPHTMRAAHRLCEAVFEARHYLL